MYGVAALRDHLFTASADRSVKVWETDGFTCRQTLEHSVAGDLLPVRAVAAAGGRIAFGGEDNAVTVRHAYRNCCVVIVHLFACSLVSLAVCWGLLCVLCAWEQLWDLERMTTHTLTGHGAPIVSLAFDGERLLSASYDNSICVWGL